MGGATDTHEASSSAELGKAQGADGREQACSGSGVPKEGVLELSRISPGGKRGVRRAFQIEAPACAKARRWVCKEPALECWLLPLVTVEEGIGEVGETHG